MMKETKGEEGSSSFWSDLSSWNIIMAVIMIAGFYATTVGFRTHISDFEILAKSEIVGLKEKDKDFEQRVREMEMQSVKISSELKYIHSGIDEIKNQLNKLAEQE